MLKTLSERLEMPVECIALGTCFTAGLDRKIALHVCVSLKGLEQSMLAFCFFSMLASDMLSLRAGAGVTGGILLPLACP